MKMRDYFFEPDNLVRYEAAQVEEENSATGDEPSEYAAICALRPEGVRRLRLPDAPALEDRMLGAWLGRAVGCLLGKHVEGMGRADIETYLRAADAYPLNDYIPLIEPPPVPLVVNASHATKGNFTEMARDDDMDFTLIGLHILEQYGANFTTDDVAFTWLSLVPFQMLFTAERAAYRNLVNEVAIPETATQDNPFREWIGAQIRADGWAYGAAALPEQAAAFAWRDARLSHIKNGIYGEMWAAAMIAAAFEATDAPMDAARIERLIQIGLSEIPAECRLAQALHQLLEWRRTLSDWETAWAHVDAAYGHYHWIHTINNAVAVALALLYGEGDFSRSISIAVMCGWDADCNGATVGSVLGAALGARQLPARWTDPLNDRLRSAVFGYDGIHFSALAQRSTQLRLALFGEA